METYLALITLCSQVVKPHMRPAKKIAKQHEKLYKNTIPLNKGFERRIDLLLKTRGIEITTNEFKTRNVSEEICVAQQTKNMRTNKAILSHLLELPIETDTYILAMDWIGKLT